MHPAFCFAGVLFIIAGRKSILQFGRQPPVYKIVAVCAVLYALFLAGIPFQNLRYLLLTYPLVLIVLYPGFVVSARYLEQRRNNLFTTVLVIIVVIQLLLFCRVFLPFYHGNKIDKAIAARVSIYPAQWPLYTFSIDGALKHYDVHNPIVNLWAVKLDTVVLANPALVLFNVSQFQAEWKDKNPMLNWAFLQKQHTLKKLEDLPDNWELYELR